MVAIHRLHYSDAKIHFLLKNTIGNFFSVFLFITCSCILVFQSLKCRPSESY